MYNYNIIIGIYEEREEFVVQHRQKFTKREFFKHIKDTWKNKTKNKIKAKDPSTKDLLFRVFKDAGFKLMPYHGCFYFSDPFADDAVSVLEEDLK